LAATSAIVILLALSLARFGRIDPSANEVAARFGMTDVWSTDATAE
jgi:hypothetical protein